MFDLYGDLHSLSKQNPKQAAEEFTNKHGYLGEWIANNIAELIPPR